MRRCVSPAVWGGGSCGCAQRWERHMLIASAGCADVDVEALDVKSPRLMPASSSGVRRGVHMPVARLRLLARLLVVGGEVVRHGSRAPCACVSPDMS